MLALLLAGVLVVTLLADALTTESDFTTNPESKKADNLLKERLRGPRKASEIVIIRSETLTVDNPAYQNFVTSLHRDITALGSDIVEGGVSYYLTGDKSLVSADRRTTILPFVMAGDYFEASDQIGQLRAVLRRAEAASSFQVFLTGEASINRDFQEVSENDLQSAELFGIPVAFIILIVVFGALAAAAVPLVLAIATIVIALGATALLGQAFEMVYFVTNMISVMGLAVGIDYSLLILSRFREERRRGIEKGEAIAHVGATAGRTVLFSGITVVLALSGLLILPFTIFRSMAAGAILVVLFTVLASLTLLPAVLSLMGDKVNALRLPFLQLKGSTSGNERGGFWGWVTRRVMQYPVLSISLTAALLIAAAIPFLDIKTGAAGINTLPDSFQSKQGFLILQKEFSAGLAVPAEVVIDGQVNSQPVTNSIERLKSNLQSDAIFGPARLVVNSNGDLALLSVPVAVDASSNEAFEAIRRLRSQYIPQAFDGVPAEVLVTGATAFNVDFVDLTNSFTPLVFALVLGTSFILLTIVFRSLVIPAKAILMNLLSVGAAYGLLVLVFQKGVGDDLLGFQRVDRIEAWLPLFLFSILFGLSMDYHVFLLSRIRERFDHTGNNSESVAFGLRSTAGIITGAALIMVAVFSAFASGDLVMLQQFGFGLAVAVLIDATIVRSIMVPSAMQLLGKRNWYLPKALHWLPNFRAERIERS